MALSGLFAGNERKQKGQQLREQKGVCPAGQSLTLKWPVLRQGSVPQFDRAHWDLQGFGQVRNSLKLSWQEFNRLPRITTSSDFHCVTRWSRFDNHRQGIAFRRDHKTGRAAAGSEIRSRAPPSRDTRRISPGMTLIATMSCRLRITMASPWILSTDIH